VLNFFQSFYHFLGSPARRQKIEETGDGNQHSEPGNRNRTAPRCHHWMAIAGGSPWFCGRPVCRRAQKASGRYPASFGGV